MPKRTEIKIKFLYLLFLSFLIWSISFSSRILVDNSIDYTIDIPSEITSDTVLHELNEAFYSDQKKKAASIIFFQNIKSCIVSILGGVLIGIGTIANLAINGFFTANVFCTVFHNGFPVNLILKHTLPHSAELIGIWIAGAIGFDIAVKICNLIVSGVSINSASKKTLLIALILMCILIFIASIIEVYLSTQI